MHEMEVDGRDGLSIKSGNAMVKAGPSKVVRDRGHGAGCWNNEISCLVISFCYFYWLNLVSH